MIQVLMFVAAFSLSFTFAAAFIAVIAKGRKVTLPEPPIFSWYDQHNLPTP